jgi:hypothetical protein
MSRPSRPAASDEAFDQSHSSGGGGGSVRAAPESAAAPAASPRRPAASEEAPATRVPATQPLPLGVSRVESHPSRVV